GQRRSQRECPKIAESPSPPATVTALGGTVRAGLGRPQLLARPLISWELRCLLCDRPTRPVPVALSWKHRALISSTWLSWPWHRETWSPDKAEFCLQEATGSFCTGRQYYWYDERGKKVKCTAPQYVDFVMSSVQKLVTDEDVFPTKYGREFPSSFESLVRKICRHLFHVLAHIYWAHFKETLALELHGHLNTLYVHFILFAREFNLLDPKETAIMDDLTEVLCSGAGGVHSGGSGDGASSGGPGAQNHVKER
uniref:MOB kinase activator 2 n=1 Tax=Macaca fascicularis TaxID=9541 RepID=A0A7N9CB15_MACFA